MRLTDLKSSVVALGSAAVASLCCLLPLAVVVLGLGSGAFMAVTMQYSAIFIPAGILGTAAGYYLYLRERRRCDRLGCAMVGSRINLALLGLSTVVLTAAVTLTAFPRTTAELIAAWGGGPAMTHGAMAPAGPAAAGHGARVAAAHVVLQVDGMT